MRCRRKQLADVTVQGQPVVCQAPDQPFTYLGVDMTLTINWQHQYKKVLNRVRDLSQVLYHNMATSGQKVNMISTLVKPTITNTFMVAPYTALQIRTLYGLVAGIAYRLPRSTPTAMVMEDTARFGMGCPSLLVDYMQAKVKYLTEAINHPCQLIWHNQSIPTYYGNRPEHLAIWTIHNWAPTQAGTSESGSSVP
jgi:hypothetical protein